MLKYLRLSPTYELARKARTSNLTSKEKKLLPKDFEQVLKPMMNMAMFPLLSLTSGGKQQESTYMALSTSNLKYVK